MGDHYDTRWITRSNEDDLARHALAMPLYLLLAAAEGMDEAPLRRLADAARAAADRLERRPPVLGQRTYPLAAILLRELAARAEHNRNRALQDGRQMVLTPCRN